MALKLLSMVHTAIILTQRTNEQPIQYGVEIVHSDPFKTPQGVMCQGQYVKSGTVFVIAQDDLTKQVAVATAAGFKADDSFDSMTSEPE